MLNMTNSGNVDVIGFVTGVVNCVVVCANWQAQEHRDRKNRESVEGGKCV